MWLIYALLSAITAAGVAIFAKMGLRDVDTVLATTIRSIIMAIFLVLVSLSLEKFKGFSFGGWSGRDWNLIILAGISGAVSWIFYFMALKSGLASKVSAIDRTSLVFIAVFAILFLGESFKWKTIVGALVIVGGAILITL